MQRKVRTREGGRVKIAVYGAGAVGGYFGGRLAVAGADVHFIARGAQLNALRTRGLTVTSAKGDFHIKVSAGEDASDIGSCDYVLLGVKSFDTDEVAARLAPLLDDRTGIISFQNGIDNEERIARAVGPEHVMGGAAYIFAKVADPGVIAHTGGPARIVFGELDESYSERARRFLEQCVAANIDAVISENIAQVLWDKFAFICAQSGMTAAIRLPIGAVRAETESRAAFERIVEEVCAVAAAEGVELPSDTPSRHMGFADRLEADGYSSLYDDLVRGRRMELEALHGTVVARARRHNVPAPVCETIYAILKPLATRNEAPTKS
jgi:2-dehydropantoate 2-reductase